MKQEINFLIEVNLPPQGRTIIRYPEVQREWEQWPAFLRREIRIQNYIKRFCLRGEEHKGNTALPHHRSKLIEQIQHTDQNE